MKITSMDISNKEFKKALRGYNAEEVDEFLDKVAEDYELLYKEASSLKEKVTVMNERLEHYSRMETTIQNTLLLAQNAAEQSKKLAQKEADLIIKGANDSAQKILDKAHNDVLKINDDYDRVKQEFVKFRSKFKNFMNTQMDTFNSLENDFIKNYNVGTVVEESIKEKETESQENFKADDVKDIQINEDEMSEIKSFFVNE